ncbi:response regulator transcription factor [Spirosoma pollinicola]|uniref:Phosphate regulon transcriptional regulatory protein PhoB n=1 Tax=Spirosoma pollinicola TaxID=2057025 RepID=A0A2K8Z0Z3_9BACT|nr:response regulator transcription factor [Spirosoma pollinicola]AUD03488.1 DNA-binding response regulator [Spirosoma pollinicola]
MKTILLIEDDALIVDLVRIHLHTLPANVLTAASGRDGLGQLAHQAVDLCILDVMLPDMNGIEICRQIRQRDTFTPILMLTAKAQETDKVAGLEAGADDYLTKPFGVQELMARVRAMLRRSALGASPGQVPPLIITHEALRIHTADRIVTINNNRVELTPKEFDLLVLLAENPGKSYSRKELLHLVWDYHIVGYEHTVTAHINRLRNKIESNFAQPTYILTSWGVGYRFAEPVKSSNS